MVTFSLVCCATRPPLLAPDLPPFFHLAFSFVCSRLAHAHLGFVTPSFLYRRSENKIDFFSWPDGFLSSLWPNLFHLGTITRES